MSATGGHDDLRDEPIGDLLRRLSEETSTLVRQELQLAKAEMQEKGREASKSAGMFGGAGLTGLLAAGALTACLILALDTAMAGWLAALIVGVVLAAIAAVLAMTGKSRLERVRTPLPEQTRETVKEDVEWAKTRARSATR